MREPELPLRLLSLDGGGIRGLSSLYILRAIMIALESKQQPPNDGPLRPCDVFDLIAGTSTGGLIAVMLGVLRMDVQTCIDKYIELASKIFPVENILARSRVGKTAKTLIDDTRFDPAPFEKAIKALISDYLRDRSDRGEHTLLRFEASRDTALPKCKVVLCATAQKGCTPWRFRNYSSPWAYTDDCEIWEACRATSAAPTFFPPVKIGKHQTAYVDGGLHYNNPIIPLIDEASSIWRQRAKGCIVSIGTGELGSFDIKSNFVSLVGALKELATDTRDTARDFKQSIENQYGIEQKGYFRFNVQQGLGHVGIEEWKEFDRVEIATIDYLVDQRAVIQSCAAQLHDPHALVPLENQGKTDAITNVLRAQTPLPLPTRTTIDSMQASQDNLRFPITGTGSSSGFRKPFTLTGIPAINKFISRPSEMDFLERELFPLGSVRRRKKILVIHGLGGIGKTQLAIEFARNHREKFSSIFWINGKSHDSLIESFNQILQKISKARDSVFDDSQLLSVENIREEVLHWLELQGNDKWLLIFDNCDSDKDDPGGYELSNYLPASDCGSIIITTRRSHLAVLGTADLAVGKMNIQQSLNVLERNLGQGFSDDDESKLSRSWAEKLVLKLDGLPLALVQAAYYIRETGVALATYYQSYEDSWAVLVEKLPRILEYPNGSIQTTWTMSFNDIKAKDESASKLLELFAFYDNHDIWLNLLRSGDPDFPCPLWFQEIVKSPVVLLEKFKLLLDYSMIQQTVEVESYSMHSVVHEWLGWISERNKAELARIAIITVAFASPGHEEDGYWSAQKRLLPHSGHLLKYMVGKDRVSIAALPMPRADSNSSTPYPLKTAGPHMEHPLVRICQLYSDQELFDIGKSIIQAAVVQFEMEVGTHHPITVWSIALLAQFNANLRQYQDAEELSQRALDGFDKLFGSNNTMSMEVLIDLINIYIDERKLTDAKKLAEELQARGIGSDDRLSTYFLNTLGIMYWETGDQEKSIAANLKSLERSEKEFGPHNRHTLGIVSNLAKHYRGCKMFQESECMFNRALEGYKDIFGLEHRNTADIIYNLGMLYSEMGESAKAESLLRQSIPILEAFYGEESRQTTRIKYDLGLEYLRQGKIDEAEEIFECILPHCKHIFGQDDEQTQGVVSFLGATYLGNGRLDEALDMAHQNIEGCERIYGGDSPATQSAYLDLGTILMVQGNLGEAERAFCRVTECCLPSDSSNRHPTAISAAQGLAATLHLQCMNEYKDFQLESKKHQPGLKSFPVPSHQILGLTKLLQKYGSSEWQVFTCLGQVLKRFVGDTDARIAYQQQAIRKDGILRYTGWRCDGCGTDILRERFVCVGCEDVDFCKKCSNQYKKGKLEVKDCKGHDLFDVSLPSKLGFKKSIVCGEASGQEWLASLLAKYGGSE